MSNITVRSLYKGRSTVNFFNSVSEAGCSVLCEEFQYPSDKTEIWFYVRCLKRIKIDEFTYDELQDYNTFFKNEVPNIIRISLDVFQGLNLYTTIKRFQFDHKSYYITKYTLDDIWVEFTVEQ